MAIGNHCFILLPVETILADALGQEAAATVAEKRDLLERLLARLAHEIRNPLSSLDIHVQLLEEDLDAFAPGAREKLGSRLEIIHGELHRLESIVENFLRLAGPSALDLEAVDLAKLVNHVCDLLRPEAARREIALVAAVGTADGPVVIDPVRLTQAVMNMVINAMQAVEKNGRIEVAAAASSTGISITVRDNGPGIPAERMDAIFDPYFTTKPEGSGLGLWIAQKIVVAHGGVLTAQNGPVAGAVFTMSLPLRSIPGG